MKQLPLFLKAFAVAAIAFTLAPEAAAQAARTWVAGTGDDVNPCSLTAPCKTFARAITQTLPGGIIDVLSPGGYGSVTITEDVTIDGSGGSIAGVLATGVNGIVVNSPGVHVTLRNLDIEGDITGLIGVSFLQGAALTIQNCRIYGFQGGNNPRGVSVTANSAVKVMISNTDIRENGVGIHLETTAGQVLLASLDNVNAENNASHGLEVTGPGSAFARVRRSSFDNNAGDGLRAVSSTSTLTVTETSASFNSGVGINGAASGARVRASGNVLVNNSFGFGIAGGAIIESDATNRIGGTSTPPNATFVNQ
jgi:hypothetical protein